MASCVHLPLPSPYPPSSPFLLFPSFRSSSLPSLFPHTYSFLLTVDGFIVSERFLHRVRICEIREEVKTTFWPAEGLTPLSDHWPVMLSLEMEEL